LWGGDGISSCVGVVGEGEEGGRCCME
jgi:hypothetical protein